MRPFSKCAPTAGSDASFLSLNSPGKEVTGMFQEARSSAVNFMPSADWSFPSSG